MSNEPQPQYMNAKQAADYLGVSRQRVYELTRAGRIGEEIGGYWLYTQAQLDAYKAQRDTNIGGRPKGTAATPATVSAAV